MIKIEQQRSKPFKPFKRSFLGFNDFTQNTREFKRIKPTPPPSNTSSVCESFQKRQCFGIVNNNIQQPTHNRKRTIRQFQQQTLSFKSSTLSNPIKPVKRHRIKTKLPDETASFEYGSEYNKNDYDPVKLMFL